MPSSPITAVWFDSVTMFVFFLTLGRFLEMRARHRSIDRSAALSSALPNTATRIEDGEHLVVPISQLVRGDRLLIRAGESIPADGILATGTTSVDEALLTGEPRPQLKTAGDELAAGSINVDGMIEMTVTRTGGDTTLGTISRMSERARYARPAFVTLADRILEPFTGTNSSQGFGVIANNDQAMEAAAEKAAAEKAAAEKAVA